MLYSQCGMMGLNLILFETLRTYCIYNVATGLLLEKQFPKVFIWNFVLQIALLLKGKAEGLTEDQQR